MSKRLKYTIVGIYLALFVITIRAQINPINSNRISPYWTSAGSSSSAHTTQCSSTIAAYTGSSSTIDTAIQNCTAGQHVQLGAGTFNLTSGLDWTSSGGNDKSDVELWGTYSGGANTRLHITGSTTPSGCGGQVSAACIVAYTGNYAGSPQGTADWISGYTIGTSTITINNFNGFNGTPFGLPIVGSVMFLDQIDSQNAGVSDNGGYWTCDVVGSCCSTCDMGPSRAHRPQVFFTTVTAISDLGGSSYSVTLKDPLFHPNWNEDPGHSNPGAWWMDYQSVAIHDVGLRHLTIDVSDLSGLIFGFKALNVTNLVLDDVSIINTKQDMNALWSIQQGSHVSVTNSYFYGVAAGGSGHYGIKNFGCTSCLYQNNISWSNGSYVTDGATNTVWGYNFSRNDGWSANPLWMQPTHYNHHGGNGWQLIEGGNNLGAIEDVIHGPAFFVTMFRNYFTGWQNGTSKGNSNPFQDFAQSRYENVVGNVLGTPGYHTTYEYYAGLSSNTPTCNHSIFALGWSGNCQTDAWDDTHVRSTLMRWGNYDTVNAANRFVSGEVPSSDSFYPNTVPVSNDLPASLYLSGQPSWWSTPYGTPSWPATGPDVTGGDSTLGGHVKDIPAKLCWQNAALDATYDTTYTITGSVYNATGIDSTYPLLMLTLGATASNVHLNDSLTLTSMNPSSLNGSYLAFCTPGGDGSGGFICPSNPTTSIGIGFLTNPNYVSGGNLTSPDVRTIAAGTCYNYSPPAGGSGGSFFSIRYLLGLIR